MNTEPRRRYALRLPDGSYLGRMTVTGGIIPVNPPFARTFDDPADAEAHRDHTRAVLGFPEARVVAAPVFDRQAGDYLHAEL